MVEVSLLPGPERRRKWSAEEKRRIVEESAVGGALVADVARRHGLHPNQVHAWRRRMRRQGLPAVPSAMGFAAVNVASPGEDAVSASSATRVEIVLRNGRVLRLHLHLGQVARLAEALESGGR
jgi:transposase